MNSLEKQSPEDDRKIVWNTLFNSQIDRNLPSNTAYSWCEAVFGLDLGPRLENLPSLLEIQPPNFTLIPMGENASRKEFFKRLSLSQLMVNQNLRELNGQDQEDYFYYAFGQIPHLFNEEYCELLRLIGSVHVALGDDNPIGRKMIENVYFKFFDYGSLISDGEVRAVGAGIISSKSEMAHFLAKKDKRAMDFDIRYIMVGDFRSDDYQPVYCVFESFKQVSQHILDAAKIASTFDNQKFTTWENVLKRMG